MNISAIQSEDASKEAGDKKGDSMEEEHVEGILRAPTGGVNR
jgi:hypothetical protein